jgi:hypothetical protein
MMPEAIQEAAVRKLRQAFRGDGRTRNVPAEILQLTASFCGDAYIRMQAEA